MLARFLLAVSIVFSFPVYDIPMDYDLQKYTYNLCKEYDLSYELVLGVINTESSFNVRAVNKRSKGLMQLNSDTYPWIAKELGVGNFDPYNAKQNILAGVWYLNYLREYWQDKGYSDEYVFSLMLISYNRGIGGCHKYINKNGFNNIYVNKVYEYKVNLEQNGAIRMGDLRY